MKRWTEDCGAMYQDKDGEWVLFSDVTTLDKPAALMALMEYSREFKPMHAKFADAIDKLAAAIIAEVEAEE